MGYEYAKAHYDELIADMQQDETFKVVTHSEGAAYGAGIAQYLLEKGRKVDTIVHLSADEGDEFTTPESPKTYQLGYGGDIVTHNYMMKGTDRAGVVEKFNSMIEQARFSHGSTKSSSVWKEVEALLWMATQNGQAVNVTDTYSGVKFVIVQDADGKKK